MSGLSFGRSMSRPKLAAFFVGAAGLVLMALSGSPDRSRRLSFADDRRRRVLSIANVDTSSAEAAGTRVSASICSSSDDKACLAAVEWSRQAVAAQGCEKLFLDVGANIGVHSRFAFEPELYQPGGRRHYYDDVLDAAFGASRRPEELCAIAFEPNPAHQRRHQELAEAYAKMGWRYRVFFAGAGGRHSGHTLTFMRPDAGSNSDWGFRTGGHLIEAEIKANEGKTIESFEVPVIDLAEFLNENVGRARPSKVVMKMDIEGSEFAVLPHMYSRRAFENIDVMTIEYHPRFCPMTISLPGGKEVTYSQDACWNFVRGFPTMLQTEYDTVISTIDDESFLNDGKPYPSKH